MTIQINRTARRGLSTLKHFRNGMYPASYPHGFLVEETNRLVSLRTKAVELGCAISLIPSLTSSSRTRWRAVYHSSTHAGYLWVRFEAAQVPLGTGAGPAGGDPYVKVLVEDSGGTDIGTAEFHYGANPGTSVSDTPSYFGAGYMQIVDTNGDAVQIDPQTDYYITVTDEGSRAIAVSIYEEALEPTEANGYVEPATAAGAPIFDGERAIIPKLRDAWKRGAASLWHWSSNTDATAPTRTASTSRNWIDQTFSGSFGSGEPLVKLYLANKTTVRRTTVPCKWFVNASRATSGTATVSLVGLNAGIVAVQNITSSSAAWVSATVNLPAAEDSYVLLIAGTGTNAITFYASSLLQYE